MTGQELIAEVTEKLLEYDAVELFARGETYRSRDQLKRLGFEWLAHDREWRTTVCAVRGGGLWAKPVHISETDLDVLIAAGCDITVEV